jgi:hypothetical protein
MPDPTDRHTTTRCFARAIAGIFARTFAGTVARYGRVEYVDIIDYAIPCAEIIRREPIPGQIFLEFFIQ